MRVWTHVRACARRVRADIYLSWKSGADVLTCVLHLRKTFYSRSVKAFAILPKVTTAVLVSRALRYLSSLQRLISRNVTARNFRSKNNAR